MADQALHTMGVAGFRPSLVVIGAMDGVSFDDFHGHIRAYGWSGLFVEPHPTQFARLRENYADVGYGHDNQYENSAIADYDGTIRMLTINQDAVDRGEVHPCFGGMSAIYPPRNGLASAGDSLTVARHGELIEVNCITLPTLFERHRIDRLDVLCIDAEGWDWKILRQLDFGKYRPKLIRCEWINLTSDEQSELLGLLEDNDYVAEVDGQNLDAVPAEFWSELEAGGSPLESDNAPSHRPRNVTLVTAVFDLCSDVDDLQLRRGFGRYLDHLKRLLQVDWPMVVFTQPELRETVLRWRSAADTHVVVRPSSALREFPFYDQVQRLRQSRPSSGPRLTDRLPLYNPFALSKQFFLNDASLYNPFGTEFFLWVDGDIAGVIGDPVTQFSPECERNLTTVLSRHRMLYLATSIEAVDEAAGFGKATMAEILGREPAHLVRGRLFGGESRVIHAVNSAYYSLLAQSLEAGRMGTEEHVLTLVADAHRHLCNVQVGTGPRELFEHLQHGVPGQTEPRA